jgi:hypothetical protein
MRKSGHAIYYIYLYMYAEIYIVQDSEKKEEIHAECIQVIVYGA